MATMITAEDIELLYGQTLTSDQETEINMYIELAVGEIEAWLGRPVTLTAYTDEEVLPDANGTAYFKTTPVVSIEALTVNGDVITTPEDYLTITPYGLEDLWEQTLEIPNLTTDEIDRVSLYGAEILVSYTAGLDFPAAVRSLVLFGVLRKFRSEVASRSRSTQGHVGIKKIQAEDYLVEYERPLASSRSSGTSSILVFESETDFYSIKRFKRRMVTR